MKILFPIGSLFPAQTGGPSNTIYWMAKALTTRGVQAVIVTTNKDIKKGEVKLDKWQQLGYGLVKYCTTRYHYFPFSLVMNSFKVIRSVDVLHLTALFYPASLLVAIKAIWVGKPIVWSVRGELHKSAQQYGRFKKMIFFSILKRIPKRYITFHATSSEEEVLIRQQFGIGTRVILLPNYLELPKVVRLTTKEFYFLFVGRIHPIKGLENLLDGLAQSEKFLNSPYVLKLAGNGEEDYIKALRNKIEKLRLSEKVEFNGNVSGDKKQILFAGARFSFLVSHSENFGNVVVESLAQGTPVICSKGTPWESLEKNGAGFWVSNNPEELANIIDQIITQPQNEYDIMRLNARKFAVQEFDISGKIDKWINAYKAAIN